MFNIRLPFWLKGKIADLFLVFCFVFCFDSATLCLSMAAMKAMKTMKKMKVSEVSILKGKKEKTVGGLNKSDLVKSKSDNIVS